MRPQLAPIRLPADRDEPWAEVTRDVEIFASVLSALGRSADRHELSSAVLACVVDAIGDGEPTPRQHALFEQVSRLVASALGEARRAA